MRQSVSLDEEIFAMNLVSSRTKDDYVALISPEIFFPNTQRG